MVARLCNVSKKLNELQSGSKGLPYESAAIKADFHGRIAAEVHASAVAPHVVNDVAELAIHIACRQSLAVLVLAFELVRSKADKGTREHAVLPTGAATENFQPLCVVTYDD